MLDENARRQGRDYGRREASRRPAVAAQSLRYARGRLEDAEDASDLQAKSEAIAWRIGRETGYIEGVLQTLEERGRCGNCGRELSDPRSVAAGIGPDCLAKLAADQERPASEVLRDYEVQRYQELGRVPFSDLGLDHPDVVYRFVQAGNYSPTPTTMVKRPGEGPRPVELVVPEGATHLKSPDGHSIGYSGSGPSQMALDVLTDALGFQPPPNVYHAFKARFIAGAEGPLWEMTGTAIRSWLLEIAKDAGFDPFPLAEEAATVDDLPTVDEWLQAGAPMREVTNG